MKVWIVRAKYDRSVMKEYYDEFPYRDIGFKDGQYIYWGRKSFWTNKEKVSIQTNYPSAKRALIRANKRNAEYAKDVKILELDLVIPEEA